jgi:paraquat-inducible protein B
MAKAASATRIGAFVLGGLLLIVGGVIAFGSGAFLRTAAERSAVFGESLQGLQIGAPVTYNGVPVGEVTRIGAVIGTDKDSINNGVLFRLHGGSVTIADDSLVGSGAIVDALEAQGLRVQLGIQSFVTGALYLRLVFAPDVEAYPAPETFFGRPTMPAVPSDMARFGALANTLGQDLPSLVGRIGALTDAVQALVDKDNRARLAETLANFAALSTDLKAAVPAVSAAVADAGAAAGDLAAVARRLDAMVAESAGKVSATLDGLSGAGAAIDSLGKAGAAIAAAAGRVDAMVTENRRGLREFTGEGLAEIRALAVQAQAMTRSVDRLARRLDSEGAGFLLRREVVQEYEPRAGRPR